METRNEMSTLSETANMLIAKGYTENFEMKNDGFTAINAGVKLSPDSVKIRKVYRFEGNSDPDDMSVLYAIESDGGIKGILIDAYGTYAGNEPVNLSEFLKKVRTEEKPI
jgi:hypothetical protein